VGRLSKWFLADLFTGLGVTLGYAFRKPVTIQYPEQHRPISPRYRGRQELTLHPDGSVKCVACGLCAAVCPSRCITVDPGELPDGRRFPIVYQIEMTRCVFCGFCEEACPYDAVVLTEMHELAQVDKTTLIYQKEDLMARESRETGPR
jgi:NADH-quinone oxidoreductase subunit I